MVHFSVWTDHTLISNGISKVIKEIVEAWFRKCWLLITAGNQTVMEEVIIDSIMAV